MRPIHMCVETTRVERRERRASTAPSQSLGASAERGGDTPAGGVEETATGSEAKREFKR